MTASIDTVLITGATQGLGFDMARGFLAAGSRVVLNGRNAAKLTRAADALGESDRVATVVGDIGDPATGRRLVDEALARFGRVDVLINNAGIFEPKPFLEVEETDLLKFWRTNLLGTFFTSQAAARVMKVRGGGAIINIGTVLIDHAAKAFPVTAPMTSKGAVHGLTVNLAAELADDNIRVNTIAAGIIRTPLHNPEQVDQLAGMHLLNRIGEPRDITEAALFLAQNNFTTGVILPVDGGNVAGR
ncbi:SDR family NAD(P)-dependent oxidoreductase [Acanthopleuribacter pedis]|uniref:SDR family oxidoreductase n=1 Tax=Acanthopleuribacter pedis TaxID=442870 RepID=A0A8J7QFE4_9BACT|nr:SDR family oxidoreductase [Acanthopleuribacter pedis]MBO1317425.1 SDR family oxidoreductase [Acanthopleuribacter pedis]